MQRVPEAAAVAPMSSSSSSSSKVQAVSEAFASAIDTGLLCVHDAVADGLQSMHTHSRSFITNHAVPLAKKLAREAALPMAATGLCSPDELGAQRMPDLDIKCQVRQCCDSASRPRLSWKLLLFRGKMRST